MKVMTREVAKDLCDTLKTYTISFCKTHYLIMGQNIIQQTIRYAREVQKVAHSLGFDVYFVYTPDVLTDFKKHFMTYQILNRNGESFPTDVFFTLSRSVRKIIINSPNKNSSPARFEIYNIVKGNLIYFYLDDEINRKNNSYWVNYGEFVKYVEPIINRYKEYGLDPNFALSLDGREGIKLFFKLGEPTGQGNSSELLPYIELRTLWTESLALFVSRYTDSTDQTVYIQDYNHRLTGKEAIEIILFGNKHIQSRAPEIIK